MVLNSYFTLEGRYLHMIEQVLTEESDWVVWFELVGL